MLYKQLDLNRRFGIPLSQGSLSAGVRPRGSIGSSSVIAPVLYAREIREVDPGPSARPPDTLGLFCHCVSHFCKVGPRTSPRFPQTSAQCGFVRKSVIQKHNGQGRRLPPGIYFIDFKPFPPSCQNQLRSIIIQILIFIQGWDVSLANFLRSICRRQ